MKILTGTSIINPNPNNNTSTSNHAHNPLLMLDELGSIAARDATTRSVWDEESVQLLPGSPMYTSTSNLNGNT